METKKSLNEFSELVFNCDDVIELLLDGGTLDSVIVVDDEEVELYNNNVEQILHEQYHINNSTYTGSVEEFHEGKINTWFFPKKYKDIDLESYLLGFCRTQQSIDRVMKELRLYQERNLTDVLRLFIFLVDYFRENGVVWGVGRGSSVASYILYLIGVHKINSIDFNLQIEEFLK